MKDQDLFRSDYRMSQNMNRNQYLSQYNAAHGSLNNINCCVFLINFFYL